MTERIRIQYYCTSIFDCRRRRARGSAAIAVGPTTARDNEFITSASESAKTRAINARKTAPTPTSSYSPLISRTLGVQLRKCRRTTKLTQNFNFKARTQRHARRRRNLRGSRSRNNRQEKSMCSSRMPEPIRGQYKGQREQASQRLRLKASGNGFAGLNGASSCALSLSLSFAGAALTARGQGRQRRSPCLSKRLMSAKSCCSLRASFLIGETTIPSGSELRAERPIIRDLSYRIRAQLCNNAHSQLAALPSKVSEEPNMKQLCVTSFIKSFNWKYQII